MVLFKNATYGNFLLETENLRIICYGAGGTLRDFLKNNRAHFSVMDKIDYILDRDRAKSGTAVSIGLRDVPVRAIDEMLALGIDFSRYAIILCLAGSYVTDALKMLDEIPAFDGVSCYYGLSALSWGREIYPSPLSVLPVIKTTFAIPKSIHYCWFGENGLSQMELDCIESWKRNCPDYTIKLWNEENYDISKAPLYVRQAYEAKKYAFVSDYARLDIIYHYGGVYFDTDVKLHRTLDNLFCYKSFFAFESSNLINTGLGFASVAFNPMLKDLLDIYQRVLFRDSGGEMNLTSCPEYHTDYFRKLGVSINNSLQLFENILFLPSDYFCPYNQHSALYELTENTIADHQFHLSWFESGKRNEWISMCKETEPLNSRFLADWKRSVFRDG